MSREMIWGKEDRNFILMARLVTVVFARNTSTPTGFTWVGRNSEFHAFNLVVGTLFIMVHIRTGTIRYRLNRWRYRLQRARLFLTPGPVCVAFHGYCCDSGSYSWGIEYESGREAFRATTWKALEHISDGPTDYEICSQEDIERLYWG